VLTNTATAAPSALETVAAAPVCTPPLECADPLTAAPSTTTRSPTPAPAPRTCPPSLAALAAAITHVLHALPPTAASGLAPLATTPPLLALATDAPTPPANAALCTPLPTPEAALAAATTRAVPALPLTAASGPAPRVTTPPSLALATDAPTPPINAMEAESPFPLGPLILLTLRRVATTLAPHALPLTAASGLAPRVTTLPCLALATDAPTPPANAPLSLGLLTEAPPPGLPRPMCPATLPITTRGLKGPTKWIIMEIFVIFVKYLN